MGFNRDGGYAPYQLVSESIFFGVDADISPAEATLLLEVMGTGGHAISRAQMVRPDIQSLLICGAGPIGLGLLAMAKLRLGNIPVLVSDVSPFRLQLAAQLGGLPVSLRDANDAPIPLREGLARHGFGEVFSAIDSSGKSVARHEALEVLAARGVLVCVGHGEGLHLDVSRHLIAPERAVLGSEYFRFDELPANYQLLRRHRAYLRQIITHHFDGAEIGRAFELFFSGQTGKVIVQP
jgi:threonine dehydrogenase-like Zn-dependent dehydrogenase